MFVRLIALQRKRGAVGSKGNQQVREGLNKLGVCDKTDNTKTSIDQSLTKLRKLLARMEQGKVCSKHIDQWQPLASLT